MPSSQQTPSDYNEGMDSKVIEYAFSCFSSVFAEPTIIILINGIIWNDVMMAFFLNLRYILKCRKVPHNKKS